jgi:hypothetical protein
MTTPSTSTSLPPDLLARDQQAQVLTAEANARKAVTDADTSALTLAQNKYKSLVPDLTGVSASTVDDKSTGVAFSGLVTYSALHHAAEMIGLRIKPVLADPDPSRWATVLVTSQSDLLTSDLLASTVSSSLEKLLEFADKVLAEDKEGPKPATGQEWATLHTEIAAGAVATALAGGLGAVTTAGLGPLGIGAAAAAAIPSIISLFSSTTTVKDQTENITDLATTTAVVAAAANELAGYTVVHEDFRLAPEESPILNKYRELADKRMALVFQQEQVQKTKNDADLKLSRAQQQQDAAKKATPPKPDDPDLDTQVNDAQNASANAAASLAVISGTINSIDAFTTAVNATAAGSRSPLAIAVLSELLHQDKGNGASADGIGYVLSVKGLGGQSVEYTKNRHVGTDSYTTLADAPVAFMLYDLKERKIISSGIANGVSSVHGRLGHPPTGLIGPNSLNAIEDQTDDASPEDPPDTPAEPHQPWWRRIF